MQRKHHAQRPTGMQQNVGGEGAKRMAEKYKKLRDTHEARG